METLTLGAELRYKFNKKPEMSIIIPSVDGDRDGNVFKLVDSLKKQTFKEIEIIVAIGESPNGHARNVGVTICSKTSKYLAFFDDDVLIEDNEILKKFAVALNIQEHGLVGASQQPPKGSSLTQKWISYDLAKASISVQTSYFDTEMVTHAGMACRRDIWELHNGEDSSLITGTDTDLRARIRCSGYKVVIVPGTLVFHPLPNSFLKVLSAAYRNGWHQYDFRLKHGFQSGILSMFPKIRSKSFGLLLILREIIVLIPHAFYANRTPSFGFRPLNALFRFFMSWGYIMRSLKEAKEF